ncbi:testis-expressed sequence 2 protein [Rhypophila decipiens]
MGWALLFLTYLLGGITFLPLLVAAGLLYAHLTFPYRQDVSQQLDDAEDVIVQPGDDLDALKKAQKEEAKLRGSQAESDVAAGYFAVCREYTPMGINAKPIERTTPVGSATVAAPSPSVYQTMYRSIFDRKSVPGPLDHKNGTTQRPKRTGNVFFVVLRHGHLLLFDDDEQLEVRHVVSLAHHDISIYSGEPTTPEGELFIKRNAICLSRRTDGPELGPDGQVSKPFYLFSENCSAKEDFYFALLRNQRQTFAGDTRAPSPLQFDVKHIISLVQRLHSSEDHIPTRWLNAMIGRMFLAVYKTKDMEHFIREKLMKKISRVNKPSFLSNIEIRGIDTGESAPYITNPRLKDLTVEGEWGMEADVRYTGNFRLEVATTVLFDFGSRFKQREINVVLAVVIRKLEGHALIKIKPPPSNRLWFSFQQMPKIEMTVEPIISSRQITWNLILRQIENRIKEVIAETLVLPFWDDTPFFKTEHKLWRGGIFHDDRVESSLDLENLNTHEIESAEVDRVEDDIIIPESSLPPMEKSHSMPVIDHKSSTGLFGRKISTKSKLDSSSLASASSTSIDLKNDPKSEGRIEAPPAPRPVRAASFVQPASPVVETDATNADMFKPSSSPPNQSSAASAMATLSAQTMSSPASPAPYKPYITSKSSSQSSTSSREVTDTERDLDVTPQPRRNTQSSTGSQEDSAPKSPSLSSRGTIRSQTGSIRSLFGRRDTASSPSPVLPGSAHDSNNKRTALAAVANAAASAKRWGLGALQRSSDGSGSPAQSEPQLDLKQPMGRGRPLPPPGTPLPMPDRKTKTAPIAVPRRKPAAPPPLPGQSSEIEEHHKAERRPVPPPPLPKRRHFQSESQEGAGDDMLVVAAPAESEPTTPLSVSHSPSYVQPWVEDVEDNGKDILATDNKNIDVAPTEDLAQADQLSAAKPLASSGDSHVQAKEPEAKVIPGRLTKGQADNDEDDNEYEAWMDNTGMEDDKETEAETHAAASVIGSGDKPPSLTI